MKIDNPFNTWVLSMAILIFSAAFVSFAQQDTAIRDAEADAKRDASRDVNKLAWYGAGVGAGLLGLSSGIIGTDGDAVIIGAGVGIAVGSAIPLILIYSYKPNLPPERFIGKSPEYIDRYTEIYKKQTRWVKAKAVAGGCVTPPAYWAQQQCC